MTWIVLATGAFVGIVTWELVSAAVRAAKSILSGFTVEDEE